MAKLLNNERVEIETFLLDYGGTIDLKVDYRINENGSGIYLKGFKLGIHEWTVEEVVQYKPWQWGTRNPGAGQMGIYKLKDQNGIEAWAVIKDYRALEGDWRISLVRLENNEQELKGYLMIDKLGLTFADYLFPIK